MVAERNDPTLKELKHLPGNATVLFRASTIEEFSAPEGKLALGAANALLNCTGETNRRSRYICCVWHVDPDGSRATLTTCCTCSILSTVAVLLVYAYKHKAGIFVIPSPRTTEILHPGRIILLFPVVATGDKELFRQLLPLAPKLAWIHNRFTGVESLLCPEMVENDKV